MLKLKPSKKTINSIGLYTLLLISLVPFWLEGCLTFSGTKELDSEETTHTPFAITPTTTIVPTYFPTSKTSEDTIYFWWEGEGKSELWRLNPDSSSSVLYTVFHERTLDDAAKSGLLSEDGVSSIKKLASENFKKGNSSDIVPIQIIPISLSLSPDKTKLMWEEHVQYCWSMGDIFDCLGENTVRIFDLKTNKVEVTFNTGKFFGVNYQPLWLPDNQHIVFLGGGNVLNVLDISTLLVDKIGKAHTFCLEVYGHRLAFANKNGIQLYDPYTKQITHILDVPGDILELALSSENDTLVYTFFNSGENDLMSALEIKTGTNKTVIKNNTGLWLYNVQWLSKDHVVYTQQMSYPDPYYIYVIDIKAGDIVSSERVPLDIGTKFSGQLSSDRTKILFVGFDNVDTLSLMTFDFDTKTWSFIPLPPKIQETISTALKADKFWNYYRIENATW